MTTNAPKPPPDISDRTEHRPPPAPPRKSGSGRGGARTAGPGKKMGAPGKAPEERTIVKGPYRLPPDVVEILGQQRNATAFICDAVRSYNPGAMAAPLDLELEVSIGSCRCGAADFVIVNDFGVCPNGCNRGLATVSDPEGMTIPPEEDLTL